MSRMSDAVKTSQSYNTTDQVERAFIETNFFFQAEDGIRDLYVTGVHTCALPIWMASSSSWSCSWKKSFCVCSDTGMRSKPEWVTMTESQFPVAMRLINSRRLFDSKSSLV